MTFWIYLWKSLLIVGVLSFSAMALWVSIGGYRDLKRLITTLEEENETSTDSDI